MNTTEILNKLVSIPSWVDDKTNEKEIGLWIYKFLIKNSKLKITKQMIGNGRFNIIAQNSDIVDTLVTGHMDTVQVGSNWTKSPILTEIKNGKMYGRGTTDMKAGLSIMIKLATNSKLNKNTCFLFYCDEEYDFLGMKKYIEIYKNKINPKLIISMDGEGQQISNSCRGLIELKVEVEGKAGHAANPKSGINAITESFKVINKLRKWLKSFNSKELGNSTLNIACMNGGSNQGNIIAEKCQYIVEIRVANKKLNANLVKEFVIKESKNLNLKIAEPIIRHDLGSWITKQSDLNEYIAYLNSKKLKSSKKSGYIDIQMLWQTFNNVPTFSFGVGTNGMSHRADEYVKISDILNGQAFFDKILTNNNISVVK